MAGFDFNRTATSQIPLWLIDWLIVSLCRVSCIGHIHGENGLVLIQPVLLHRKQKEHNQFVLVDIYKFKKVTNILIVAKRDKNLDIS